MTYEKDIWERHMTYDIWESLNYELLTDSENYKSIQAEPSFENIIWFEKLAYRFVDVIYVVVLGKTSSFDTSWSRF